METKESAGPRLLDLKQAAAYTGLSYWTLRDLAEVGIIQRVLIPDPKKPGRNLRRILFSREALDAFIHQHETTALQKAPGKVLRKA